MPEIFIADEFLRPEFYVSLGWLVDNPRAPHQSYYPIPVLPAQVRDSEQLNFNTLLQQSSEVSLKAILTRFLSTNIETSGSSTEDISSAVAKTYTLDNSDRFFDTMVLSNEDAKVWLVRTIRKGRKAYLVVGYRTLQDAAISRKMEKGCGVGGNIQAPPLAALTGGLDSLIVGDIGDVGLGGNIKKTKGNELSFLAPGERVYGVEYRRLELKWYRRNDIDSARLQSNSIWTVRGKRSGGTKNTVEAAFADDVFGTTNTIKSEKKQEGDKDAEIEFVEDDESFTTLIVGADKYVVSVD